MADQRLLTQASTEFARTLARGFTVGDVLHDLAGRAAAVLAIDGAGVSAWRADRIRFVTAVDERCAALEQVQAADQAGPGVDACRTGKVVTVTDLRETPESSRYQQAAARAGIVAVAGVPLGHDSECIGVLGLYSGQRRDWAADDMDAARVLADLATGYVVNASELERQRRLNEQLREALDSRIVIEQAKGIIAAERGISVDDAFEVLRRHARSHAASLRTVADAVVRLGLRP